MTSHDRPRPEETRYIEEEKEEIEFFGPSPVKRQTIRNLHFFLALISI